MQLRDLLDLGHVVEKREAPQRGKTGPGTENNVESWSVSWDDPNRPGKRRSSLAFTKRTTAEEIAVDKVERGEKGVVLSSRWIAGWLY